MVPRTTCGSSNCRPPVTRGDDLPGVSVVVPAYNENARVAGCIASLIAQDYPRELLRIIVVDNGSQDGTFATLQATAGILALQEPAPGAYAARNLGLRHVTSEVVCFTDADCTAATDWVRNAVRQLACRSVGIVAGHVQLEAVERGRLSAAELFEKFFAFRQARNARENRCVTANWCSRTQLIRELGGFDATLRSGGDRELSQRIANAGYRIVYAPDAIVRHPLRASFAELTRKGRRVAGGVYATSYLARRKSFASLLWSFAKQARRRCREALAVDGIATLDRVRLISVIIALSAASMSESVRLRCGGEPLR